MNNELREAAERLRQQYANKADFVYCHKFSRARNGYRHSDSFVVRTQTNSTNDNEPVDNTWLRSILIQGGEFQYHDSMPDFLKSIQR